ncbi:Polyvinylalcohol dehydrogenase precursor [Anatilimnocola aggregata]|uniref:Polyvinylalcohol dehydrogenase n=1 Tax=Anatilimnocola aggregata TaxID=2528021 RepID=A0A517Y4Q6_9BACT|nr:PQQ-binding-like beta-propeller repeat protein [Anatilimnocola aggregata]QDU25233.1 Polyvinylalcohol dehydrogenase precursor [Anatilimnocola aggregata]
MHRQHLFFTLAIGLVCFVGQVALAADAAPKVTGFQPAANDWPWWRGPNNNGIAAADQDPPVTWSETENVVWKTPIAGRGHSSATVVGDQVFVTTAEEDRELLAVICLERKTGAVRWRTDVHTGGMDKKGNKKTSQASSTVACDGERLYVNFLNHGSVVTTALDRQGKQVWQTKVADFATHQGFGSSPALFGSLVYVTADSKTGGAVAALSREKGEIVWQQLRPEKANYASPIVLRVAGKEQLLVSGCDLASGFHPVTGSKFWEIEGATTECVTTMVTDGERVFVSGGYPRKHVQAIVADGTGKTAWQNNVQVYVPSMIAHDGYLYATQDGGVASCWKSDTGEEMWKERLGGTFSGSLTLVGDKLYTTNESGTTFVFKANPKQFEKLAENMLTGEAFATPTICGSQIFLRVAEFKDGKRQEMVYCIGKK